MLRQSRIFGIVVVLFLQILNAPAEALEAGIETSRMNYSYSEQHSSQWCWAASIQMVMDFYGIELDQEGIVQRTYGCDPYGRLPNWAGSFQAITANLNGMMVDKNGQPYVTAAIMCTDARVIPQLIVGELSKGQPVILGYSSGPGSGHAVVCTGCSYYGYGPNLTITRIIVRDPYPTLENRRSLGRRVYRGVDLGYKIQAAWMIYPKKTSVY